MCNDERGADGARGCWGTGGGTHRRTESACCTAAGVGLSSRFSNPSPLWGHKKVVLMVPAAPCHQRQVHKLGAGLCEA